MSKQQALELAIDYLLRDWADVGFADVGSGLAHEPSQQKPKRKRTGVQRDNQGSDPPQDFDKRLQKLVEAALSGVFTRADPYRLEQASQAGPGIWPVLKNSSTCQSHNKSHYFAMSWFLFPQVPVI